MPDLKCHLTWRGVRPHRNITEPPTPYQTGIRCPSTGSAVDGVSRMLRTKACPSLSRRKLLYRSDWRRVVDLAVCYLRRRDVLYVRMRACLHRHACVYVCVHAYMCACAHVHACALQPASTACARRRTTATRQSREVAAGAQHYQEMEGTAAQHRYGVKWDLQGVQCVYLHTVYIIDMYFPEAHGIYIP